MTFFGERFSEILVVEGFDARVFVRKANAAASVEVVHLAGDLSVLLFDMAEHGGKLVVGVVLKRLVEVDCAKRLYYFL